MSKEEPAGPYFQRRAPVVELNTGLGEVVLHSRGQKERLLSPVVQLEDLQPEALRSGTVECLTPLAEALATPVGQMERPRSGQW